ncbi:hypothetical protein EHS25_006365 [Saitozyma podzolica]|uniref:Uncharacterized protein n=1 Tax=Saitozyma podzolica TaxID=1890683 RepID=A0A427YRG7_9TREE|nr:hypothetical protein EHS25_006365 [Saitozyma podzolica]
MSRVQLTPLASLRVSRYQIPAHSGIPNTSISHRPLLIYHSAFLPSSSSASSIESHLASTGVVSPRWRYTMYSTTHFHSTSHEVLCVFSGRATLCFGHEDNPDRVQLDAEAGDVMMIGSYPKGCDWDMCYGKPEEEIKVQGIKDLPWFERDPIYGDEGPCLDNL